MVISCSGSALAQDSSDADETTSGPPVVVTGNPSVEVRLSGRVHRMVQIVDDRRETDVFHTDSLQGPTILRVDVAGRNTGTISVGAILEVGLQANNPLLVDQENADAGMNVSGRLAELYLETPVGRVGAGRGFMASWASHEIDLSGTQFASLLPVGNLFAGLRFVNADTSELTDVRVTTHFADLERLLIKDRVRYDSPRYAGFQGSGGVANDGRWDLALRTGHTLGRVRVVGATTYQHEPFRDLRWRWDGGVGG